MEVALPASVDFSRRQPELPDSTTSTLMSISPNNGLSFVPGQQITWDLPSRSGLFLDGKSVFVRYKLNVVTVGATAPVIRRKPVYTSFARLDEYVGGTIVNSVSQYNQVANMVIDTNYSIADVFGQGPCWGINGASVVTNAFFDVDSAACNTGAAASTDFFLAAPLVCSFLQGTDKLFPTGLAPSVRIQLTVDTLANIFTDAAQVTSMTISSPELCFNVIDMGSQVESMVASSAPQLFIKTRGWANGTQGMPATSANSMSLIYNHRYSSIENLYFLSTSSATAKAVNLWGDSFNPLGINTADGQIQAIIGQSQYPQQPIRNQTGGRGSILQYLRECVGTIMDQRNTMCIQKTNFEQYAGDATATTVDEKVAKVIIGFPLSRLNAASPYQQTSLLAGVNAQQTPITIQLTAGTAFNSNMVFNLIAEYSQLIVLDPATRQVSVIN